MSTLFARARLLGFGLLAVAFLAGALAGAAIDRAVSDDDATAEARTERSEGDERSRSYIIDRVDMSDAQRAAIDSILDDRVRRMQAVWREVEPRLDAITDSARSEIMDVLTPEQRAEYEDMLRQRRGSRDRDDRSGGDSVGGDGSKGERSHGHSPYDRYRG